MNRRRVREAVLQAAPGDLLDEPPTTHDLTAAALPTPALPAPALPAPALVTLALPTPVVPRGRRRLVPPSMDAIKLDASGGKAASHTLLFAVAKASPNNVNYNIRDLRVLALAYGVAPSTAHLSGTRKRVVRMALISAVTRSPAGMPHPQHIPLPV